MHKIGQKLDQGGTISNSRTARADIGLNSHNTKNNHMSNLSNIS